MAAIQPVEHEIIMLLLCFWNEIILWRHNNLMQSDPEISRACIWMVPINHEISGARRKRVKFSI